MTSSFIVCLIGLTSIQCFSINDLDYISDTYSEGCFPLCSENSVPPILYSENESFGVIHAIKNLQADVEKVTDIKPGYYQSQMNTKYLIIVGTIGENKLLDNLIENKKIDVSTIKGKWETFTIQVVDNPLPEIDQALIIMGSDKRGTIFGIYDLSEKIGVSPWYWWADVPVKKHSSIFIKPGIYSLGEPKIKYRGIFINDEAPALSGWAEETFGGFNHLFYSHVFDLILRLKGNFLWPAMWGKAFYDDDSLNAELAHKYGIVISTSHHEPMMRAHDEWRRYGSGPWNYEKNKENLDNFWRNGIERMDQNESIVTIGMRGDGDEPMSENTAISLLENIIISQRKIIEEVTSKPANQIPQVWALYKEVQDYYDKGMRVPDDVTLLLCDDNWGNVRMLPDPEEKTRSGGYGMYYHFDFVGGPRSYKWLNTVQIERVWEQMNLTYQHGVDEIWLVNVGDIKPLEFPIHFFLDFAWNPDTWPAEKISTYYTLWSEQQFGSKHAQEIGEIIALYTKYNSRRKPELLDENTYSIIYDQEGDRVISEYNKLVKKAISINEKLPESFHDAFYQLVKFPVEACANLNLLYFSLAKNNIYAKQKRTVANQYAKKVNQYYNKDIELTSYYHHKVARGKWKHIMSQKHIGYSSWNEPDSVSIPKTFTYKPSQNAQISLTIDGTDKWWPEEKKEPVLPTFNPVNNQVQRIILYNQGTVSAGYTLTAEHDWINLSVSQGELLTETPVSIQINWEKVPNGKTESKITLKGSSEDIIIYAPINKIDTKDLSGFLEKNGIISIDAVNYQNKKDSKSSSWKVVPNLGRTHSAMITQPVTSKREPINKETSPFLEYEIYILEPGKFDITLFLSPTLNYLKHDGLQFAISIDNNNPEVINMHDNAIVPDWKYPEWWNNAVSNNIIKKSIPVTIDKPGSHRIKFWKIDPGVVLQRIVLINQNNEYTSYLGPPQSLFIESQN